MPVCSDICHRGCAYTVFQTVQRYGLYSAAYAAYICFLFWSKVCDRGVAHPSSIRHATIVVSIFFISRSNRQITVIENEMCI